MGRFGTFFTSAQFAPQLVLGLLFMALLPSTAQGEIQTEFTRSQQRWRSSLLSSSGPQERTTYLMTLTANGARLSRPSGQAYLGPQAHFQIESGSDAVESRIHFALGASLSVPLSADAQSRPQPAQLTALGEVTHLKFDQNYGFEVKIVEFQPQAAEFLAGNFGLVLGRRKNAIFIYIGEGIAYEQVQDVLNLMLRAGVRWDLRPETVPLELLLRAQVGVSSPGSRAERDPTQRITPIVWDPALPAAKASGPGFQLDLSALVRFKISEWVQPYVSGRFRKSDLPLNGVVETSNLVEVQVGASKAF